MTITERTRHYVAHDDPRTATANVIAMIIAGNGPFYPIYVLSLTGFRGWPALLTMLSTPFFLAVPWISRRSPVAARLTLSLAGTINTIWSIKLLGDGSGVGLFLLPCLSLAAMLFRRDERWITLPILGIILTLYLFHWELPGSALARFTLEDLDRLRSLHLFSVAALTACLGLIFSSMTQMFEEKSARPPE